MIGRVLNQVRCVRCGKESIRVIPCDGVVSHGVCSVCDKQVVLPQEDYRAFVNEHCVTRAR